MCISSKGMSNGRSFFTVVSLAYSFTKVAKYCAMHEHILVHVLIGTTVRHSFNAISMVDWNFLYISHTIFSWGLILVFFHSILKAPKLWMIFLGIFWKVKQMFWMSFFEGCQKSSHKISRVECQGWDPFFFHLFLWKNSRKFHPDRKGIVNEKPPWYKQTRTSTLAAGYT